MKKKILLISIRSDQGGGPKHMAELLIRLKDEFQVYTASPKDPPFFRLFKENSNGHFSLPHRKFSFFSLIRLLIWIKKNDIHIIHSHGRGAGIYNAILSPFSSKSVHTFHGVHFQNGFIGKIKNLIEKSLFKLFDQNIYVSRSEYLNALNVGIQTNQNFSIIPNGIEPSLCLKTFQSLTKEKAREDLNLPQNVFLMGTLSRLDHHKGNHRLIEFITSLPSKFVLAVAGEGEEKENLLQLIQERNLEDRVFLLGQIKKPIQFLRSLDIYVSASKGEGLPYSILEAKACGVPLLISKVSGHTDTANSNQLFSNKEEFIKKLGQLERLHSSLEDKFLLHRSIEKTKNCYR